MRSVSLPSFAKINLDLRVLGTRPDGYHDLRTVFQSLALFDNVTVTVRRGPLAVTCDEPDIPTDRRNLVWKAASLLHRVATGKTAAPRDIAIDLRKRVPSEAGLGGGSSNAAMTLLALNKLWKLDLDLASLTRIGARLGADVPYFLRRRHRARPRARRRHLSAGRHAAGARRDPASGLRRGDRRCLHVVRRRARRAAKEPAPRGRCRPAGRPGRRRCATISRRRWSGITRRSAASASRCSMPGRRLRPCPAPDRRYFGLFERADAARRTANDLARPGWLSLHTRTLSRREYARRVAAGPAKTPATISVSTPRLQTLRVRRVPRGVGAWPSGKAPAFGAGIRRFESFRPNQYCVASSSLAAAIMSCDQQVSEN